MQQPSEPAPSVLTPRECEVAALVAEGLSNAEIAERLMLTSGTVGNHVAHIMRRLGARNRVVVAVWAVEHGLRRGTARMVLDSCPSRPRRTMSTT